jgi:hypothetical protein
MLTVNLHNGSKGYIFASIPQATIILAFSDPKITYLSIHEICVLTELNFKEVKNLLYSLINKSNPILEHTVKNTYKNEIENDSRDISTPLKNSTEFSFDIMGPFNTPPLTVPPLTGQTATGQHENSPYNEVKNLKDFDLDDKFSVNIELFKGSLGGLKISAPIVVTNDVLHNNSDLMHDCTVGGEGLRSIHSWRNELIDACVVRRLKIASRDIKCASTPAASPSFTGSSSSSSLESLPALESIDTSQALPLDILTDQVKDALWVQSGLVVTIDDVIKRAERLVGAGIINKIIRNNESFRSIAYCYFDEEDTYASTNGVSEILNPIRGII